MKVSYTSSRRIVFRVNYRKKLIMTWTFVPLSQHELNSVRFGIETIKERSGSLTY